MGMFDRLKFNMTHPDFDQAGAGIEFQTKDLECHLWDYEITKEGRLVLHEWDWEETPEDDKPFPNAKGLKGLMGSIRQVEGSHRIVDQDFHGDLNFYGNINSGELRIINLSTGEDSEHPDPEPEWFEYIARFTEGSLTKLTRIYREA